MTIATGGQSGSVPAAERCISSRRSLLRKTKATSRSPWLIAPTTKSASG